MKTIKTKNHEILVSDEDCDLLNKYKWQIRKSGNNNYAISSHFGKSILMHRLILEPNSDMVVDHIDGNGLNNCRENLRIVSQQKNVWISTKRKTNKSGYVGVRMESPYMKNGNLKHKPWRAQIKINGKNKCLGLFETAEKASEAYKKAVLEIRGHEFMGRDN